MKTFLFFSIVVTLLFCAGHGAAREVESIRVAVVRDRPEVALSVSGPFEVIDIKSGQALMEGRDLSQATVAAVPEGLKIRTNVLASGGVRLVPKKKISVTVNKRRYRGTISIYKDEAGHILVVNTLDLESYIKGVLYHEISHKWPMDAIKAQAVAARTYAMYQKEVMTKKNYDVTADTSSQVYGGYSGEQHKTNRAVNFTAGEVLLYQNRLFPAYFHATCGGITENAAELWKIDIEPLSGVRVCGFCSGSPHYFWKAQLALTAVEKKVAGLYTFTGGLADIVVVERNPTGRARIVELRDASGRACLVSAKEFRALIGPDVLRSTNFSVLLEDGSVVFSGKGWGHGVGLCQWGALGMSKKGLSYKQILEFYYPGARIARLS